jgi:hypothetical protein
MATSTVGAMRELVGLMLDPLPDTVHVEPYGSTGPETIAWPTVLVSVARIKPGPILGARTCEAELLVVVPTDTAGPSDDELEQVLDQVLAVLDAASPGPAVTWSQAERATYRGAYPAYLITITATGTITEE